MTSKLFIHLYKNYFNISNNAALLRYQKKSKEQKKDIIEKIDKINLNDKKLDIKQVIIDCNNNLKKKLF